MIKRVQIKAVEYGEVEVDVPENASEEEIKDAALAQEENGAVDWGDREVDLNI